MTLKLERLCEVVAGACAELERRREAVNALNVFPVPDGDTGDNMALTARGVLEALRAAVDEPPEVALRTVARAALLSARGNSGVLLAQWVRGAAGALIDEAAGAASGNADGAADRGGAADVGSPPAPVADVEHIMGAQRQPRGSEAAPSSAPASEAAPASALFAAALGAGAGAAEAALSAPAPGTILSAMRAAAGAAAAPGDLAYAIRRSLAAAEEATERGRDELAALREAGVVDAGAVGFTALLAGALTALDRRAATALAPVGSPAPSALDRPSGPRFCTNLTVEGERLDRDGLARRLASLGDSLMVVGDAGLLRVHVHADEPDAVLRAAAVVGEVGATEVADMWAQVGDRRAAGHR